MKIPKVSVIIPVYNTQQWLHECIDSVLKQTMQNFEIICINDGSTDGSDLVLRKYAEEDARITVFTQENKGVSAARNAGIRVAKGEYIYFLDSDDYVAPDMLQIMCGEMEQKGLDIAFFDICAFGEGSVLQEEVDAKNRYYAREHNYPSVYTGEDLLYNLIKNDDYSCSVCKQLVRTAFLRDNQIQFYEGIIHEDELYTFQIMMIAEQVAIVPQVLYQRRVRDNSIMTQPVSYQSAYGVFVFVQEAYKLLLQKGCSKEKMKCFLAFLKRRITLSRKRFSKLTETDREEYEKLPEEEKFLFQICINDYVESMDRRKEAVEKSEARRQKIELLQQQKKEVLEKSEVRRQKIELLQQQKKEVLEKSEARRQKIELLQQQKKEVVKNLDNTKIKAAKLEKKLKEIKGGWSFRIGRVLTYLPRKIRTLFNPIQ